MHSSAGHPTMHACMHTCMRSVPCQAHQCAPGFRVLLVLLATARVRELHCVLQPLHAGTAYALLELLQACKLLCIHHLSKLLGASDSAECAGLPHASNAARHAAFGKQRCCPSCRRAGRARCCLFLARRSRFVGFALGFACLPLVWLHLQMLTQRGEVTMLGDHNCKHANMCSPDLCNS